MFSNKKVVHDLLTVNKRKQKNLSWLGSVCKAIDLPVKSVSAALEPAVSFIIKHLAELPGSRQPELDLLENFLNSVDNWMYSH